MRRFLKFLVMVGVSVTACTACSRDTDLKRPEPMCVRLVGHPRLQWFNNSAHTLYVRGFPLRTKDGFVAADQAAMLADPPAPIMGSAGPPRGLDLYPGTTSTLAFEPAGETFTWIGIVAGYYAPMGETKIVVDAIRPGGGCHTVQFGETGIEGVAGPGDREEAEGGEEE